MDQRGAGVVRCGGSLSKYLEERRDEDITAARIGASSSGHSRNAQTRRGRGFIQVCLARQQVAPCWSWWLHISGGRKRRSLSLPVLIRSGTRVPVHSQRLRRSIPRSWLGFVLSSTLSLWCVCVFAEGAQCCPTAGVRGQNGTTPRGEAGAEVTPS